VKSWRLALPLHPEYRTLPMLFYVPPLLPILGRMHEDLYDTSSGDYFSTIDRARLPIKYLASLFTAGNEGMVREVLKKLIAVRIYRRSETVGDMAGADTALHEAGLTKREADEIYSLTALAPLEDRFVIPPSHREEAIAMTKMVLVQPGDLGFGFRQPPERV
jgi:nitrate reductase beta subunit